MAVLKVATIDEYEGLAGDTKPTGVRVWSIFTEHDTSKVFRTHDGTTWVQIDVLTKDADGAVTMAHTAPSIAASTTEALAANASREYAMFINDSDEVIYIELGDDAILNEGIRLNASGGSYEMSRKIGNLDTRVVNGISASGSKVLLVTEGV